MAAKIATAPTIISQLVRPRPKNEDEDDEEDGVDAVNELHEAPVNPALHTHGMVLVASADQPAVP